MELTRYSQEGERYRNDLYNKAVNRREKITSGEFFLLMASQKVAPDCKIVVQAPSDVCTSLRQALGRTSQLGKQT